MKRIESKLFRRSIIIAIMPLMLIFWFAYQVIWPTIKDAIRNWVWGLGVFKNLLKSEW